MFPKRLSRTPSALLTCTFAVSLSSLVGGCGGSSTPRTTLPREEVSLLTLLPNDAFLAGRLDVAALRGTPHWAGLMDQLRDGIWTLGYAERNPLVEYRFRAFNMFEDMVAAVKDEVTEFILRAQVKEQLHEEAPAEEEYHEIGAAQHSTMAGFDMRDGVAAQAIAQAEAANRPAKGTSEAAKNTAGGAAQRKSSRRRR